MVKMFNICIFLLCFQCQGACGHAMESRQVVCTSKKGHKFPDALCDPDRKPDTSRACVLENCDIQWHATQWSRVRLLLILYKKTLL